MGYELHLVKTNSESWIDNVNQFTEQEWEKFRQKNTLPEWLYFSCGNISVKNPNQKQIATVVKIAKENGWHVQGDEEEIYSEDGSATAQDVKKPSIFEPVRKYFAERKARRSIRRAQQEIKIPLKVGDKVKSRWRTGGIVIKLDPEAEHGLGMIEVKWPDGTILGGFYVLHDFEKEE